MPMKEDDIQKNSDYHAVWFKFLRLPLGLRNTFQRMMDQILGDFPFCFVYVDGILVFSPDKDTHVQNLHLHGLTIVYSPFPNSSSWDTTSLAPVVLH